MRRTKCCARSKELSAKASPSLNAPRDRFSAPRQTALQLISNPRLTACAQIVRRGRPEILDEVSPVLLLAAPIVGMTTDDLLLAVAPFVTLNVEDESEVAAAAKEFAVDLNQMFQVGRRATNLATTNAIRSQRRNR